MRANINVKEFLRDTNKVISNDLSLSLHIFNLLVSLRNSFTFIFVLILLILDLIMTLSERRNVVAFLNF